MSDEIKLYGFYSPKAAQSFGEIVYLTPAGHRVTVTGLSSLESGEDYAWKDKYPVGEVTTLVKSTFRVGGLRNLEELRVPPLVKSL
jgi:hypothetical protein